MTLCKNSLVPVPPAFEGFDGMAWCILCRRRVPVQQGKYMDHESEYEHVVNKDQE